MSINSSNSQFQIQGKYPQHPLDQNKKPKKIKDYHCPCGRSYGSYPALYSHIKRKHEGNAPGEVFKPKPTRKRGRPFKYEPTNLQNQNSHKDAARHLQEYLRNVNNIDQNLFPLRQFAQQDPDKLNFMYPGNDEEQFLRYQYFLQKTREIEGQSNIPFINQQFQGENQYNFAENQNAQGVQDLTQLRNPHINLPNGNLNNEFNEFFRMRQEEKRRQVQYEQQRFDILETIYSKPYQLELRQQMQDKFNPIVLGMSQFLDPILGELISRQQQNEQKTNVINLDDDDQKQNKPIQIIQQPVNKEENKTINVNDKEKQKQKVDPNPKIKQRGELQCRQLLQNEHLKDIVRWMMSPPQELQNPLGKENYIQNSFRSCLVEFLDFSNQFLQKVQYEQILLVLVFFCDHILASTGSFQNKPQPLVYEMFMYFNSFLSQYLPKLMTFMPALNRLFIFIEYKKRISELFMWMSTWQSIQQYYHNRYFRERIIYQLQQQNLKSLQYQQNYNMYISQAQKQSLFSENINNSYPFQGHIDQQVLIPEQKTQQNPQPILFNPIFSHIVNDGINPIFAQNHIYPQYSKLGQVNQQINEQPAKIREEINGTGNQVVQSENIISQNQKQKQNSKQNAQQIIENPHKQTQSIQQPQLAIKSPSK